MGDSESSEDENLAALASCVVSAPTLGGGTRTIDPTPEGKGAGDASAPLERREDAFKWGAGRTGSAQARVGSVGEFYGAGGRGGGFGDGGSSASGGIGGAGDPNVAKLLDKLLAARWGAALAAAPAARPGGGGHATGPAAGEGVDLGDPLWRELPWGDYDADGSGCRLFRGTPPGTPLRVVVHAPAAGAAAGGAEDVMGKLLTGEPPGPRWVRNVRAIVPLESPDDSGADEAEFSGRLGAGARGVERFGRWAAKELKARGHIERTRKKRKVFEGVVVRDGRSGDVDYGPKRHGVVGDGARYAPLLA